MVAKTARDAGIDVPPDPEKYDADLFPHWHVYLAVQIGRQIDDYASVSENAKIISKISVEEIRAVTFADLIAKGVELAA